MDLIQWDKDLLVTLNSYHNEFWDGVMWMATDEVSWIPFFATIVYIMFKSKGKEFLVIALGLALTVVLCDQVSGIFKDWIARPRPSRELGIMNQLHIVNDYRGGKYGFFSSHAANTFGIAVFVSLLMRNWLFTLVMVSWALIESYTRIYLGVHYPLDIFTGVVFGCFTGFLVYKLHKLITKRFVFNNSEKMATKDAFTLLVAFIFTIFMMLVATNAIKDFLL